MDIYEGELISLIGPSGSGKTMLSNILTGLEKADSGWITINGKRFSAASNLLKKQIKIFCIRRQCTLVSQFTVAENIYLMPDADSNKFIVNKMTIKKKTIQLLKQFSLDISFDMLINKLTQSQKNIVELIKAYALGAKIIIIDNIMDSYTQKEWDMFKNVICKMKNNNISFLFESCKPDIISNIADRVVIIRKGKNVRNIYKDEYDPQLIIQLLVGSEFLDSFERASSSLPEVILQVNNLSPINSMGNIGFSLYKGEILGILDIEGNSNIEIANIITGQKRRYNGNMWFKGEKFRPTSLSKAMSLGIGYLSPYDTEKSLISNMNYSENLTLIILKKISKNFLRNNTKLIRNISKEYEPLIGINSKNVNKHAKMLDIYTRKKISLYRWFLYNSQILICVNPCAGSDLIMENNIYSFLNEFIKNRKGVIVLSQNISELSKICDRILINKNGNIIRECKKDDFAQLVKVLL